MRPTEISALIDYLGDELSQRAVIPKDVQGAVKLDRGKEAPPPLQDKSEPPLLKLLAAVQSGLKSFGCAWNFKIDAEGVKAELNPCQKNHKEP
ncbi:MAG: hypothetical protein ACR2IF_19360 [Terriglobales bacterium]